MINSIGSTMPMPSMSSAAPSMSAEQQTSVQELLANYSADNLTESDAKSITEELAAAGIAPSQELAQIMSESGFDVQAIGEMAGVPEPHMPPPPPAGQAQSSEVLSYLEEVLAGYDGQLSSEDQQSILAQVQTEFGIADGDSLIDLTV